MKSAIRRCVAAAVLATAGITLVLSIGLPHPGAAERGYGAVIGLLGCLLAVRWLRSSAGGQAPAGRFDPWTVDQLEPPPEAPAAKAMKDLESALHLGASTIGSFDRLVQPRLRALASARL